MGTITKKEETIQTTFGWSGNGLRIDGSFQKNVITKMLTNVDGSVYRTDDTDEKQNDVFVGSFNGYDRDGHIRYSFSEMNLDDIAAVQAAAKEIEAYALGGAEDETEEEEEDKTEEE